MEMCVQSPDFKASLRRYLITRKRSREEESDDGDERPARRIRIEGDGRVVEVERGAEMEDGRET